MSECGIQAGSYICHKCMQRVEGLPQVLQRTEMKKKAVTDYGGFKHETGTRE